MGSGPWFEYLEDYRHALAHRIPLYIPPRTLDDAQAAEFHRLDAEITHALRERDYEKSGALQVQQGGLGVFQPVMTHSFGEGARPVWFHGQMLNNLATVVDMGEHMLAQLTTLDG